MAIDNCQHSFETLASSVLPLFMSKMQEALTNPLQLERFAELGVGEKTLAKQLGLVGDFSGCYVLIEMGSLSMSAYQEVS